MNNNIKNQIGRNHSLIKEEEEEGEVKLIIPYHLDLF